MLWDGARKCIELLTGLSESFGIKCWRKAKYWKKVIKGQMRQVGRIKHGGGKNKEERLPKAVRIYLSKSGELEQKVAENIEELTAVVTRQSFHWNSAGSFAGSFQKVSGPFLRSQSLRWFVDPAAFGIPSLITNFRPNHWI